jgi:hypothetical protein
LVPDLRSQLTVASGDRFWGQVLYGIRVTAARESRFFVKA